MERILPQDEIDQLFRAANGEQSRPGRRQRQLARCDFRQAGQITRDQARSVGALHERFARNLGHSLGAYLRTRLDLTLVSIEQLGFGEFMQRMPESTYSASLTVMPTDVSAALQLDLSLAFPMMDLVLGGNGTPAPQPESRTTVEVTEIEEQILESIVVVIVRELQAVWQPVLDLQFAFEGRQPLAQVYRLLPPSEKIMALSFEVDMPEAHGMMNLVFPAVISTGLLRKLSEAWVYHKKNEHPDSRPRLQQKLLGARFDLELTLPPSPVPVHELIELRVGQILTFTHRANGPAQVKIAGRHVFDAQAIRRQYQRAALIQAIHPIPKPDGGD